MTHFHLTNTSPHRNVLLKYRVEKGRLSLLLSWTICKEWPFQFSFNLFISFVRTILNHESALQPMAYYTISHQKNETKFRNDCNRSRFEMIIAWVKPHKFFCLFMWNRGSRKTKKMRTTKRTLWYCLYIYCLLFFLRLRTKSSNK